MMPETFWQRMWLLSFLGAKVKRFVFMALAVDISRQPNIDPAMWLFSGQLSSTQSWGLPHGSLNEKKAFSWISLRLN